MVDASTADPGAPARFVLNGEAVEVGPVDPHLTLLQWLRASGRTGTKEGCAEGECGACAVACVSQDARGRTRFEPVNSCLVPVWTLAGRSVFTVEGLARDGALHPVQAAMVEKGGSQCGYCTPGFVVSLFCEYYRPGRSGYDPEAIGGNLCRCTGYRPIADVARSLPQVRPDDAWLPLLRDPAPPPAAVAQRQGQHEGGRFERPRSLEALLACRAAHPDAVLLGGGTDLMVYANQRGARWPMLIALDAVPELQVFEATEAELVIGAAVPLSRIEERLHADHAGELPMLEALLPLFSSRLIRNRATLGGNLGTASPIGDSPPALLALEAKVEIAGPAGVRMVALPDFFLGYRKTALGAGEVIVSVRVPRPAPRRQRFYKVSKRVMDDISTVAGAFALDLDEQGRVHRLRVAYGGIAATPVRAVSVEERAAGKAWDAATLAELLEETKGVGTPMDDHRGSAAYRRAMAGRLLEKFFHETTGTR
jgi:xanthine dehydrogenase small subunit